jgi:hypothetical protein
MFMTSTVNIGYVSFTNLGRTNKLVPIDDPQLDMNGKLIAGTGTNPRGRYAVHFHHTGADATMPPATVVGSVVNGSPGWGYVNHDSYVNFQDDVAYNVAGAAFVTETGSEIGSFIHNFAIRDTGTGGNPDDRTKVQDFGHDGDGFWFQGPGVTVQNNIATGQSGFGFIYYTEGLVDKASGMATQFSAANLADPSLANGQQFVDVRDVPIGLFQGNVTYGSVQGLGLWYHRARLTSPVEAVFDQYTAWNIRDFGASFLYDHHVTLQNSWLLGNLVSPQISVYGVRSGIEDMDDLNYVNDRMEGWSIGIRFATVGAQVVSGGFYNNIHNLEVRLANEVGGVSLTITGGVQFGTLSTAQLQGHTQVNVFMNGDPYLVTREDLFPLSFNTQATILNTSPYNGQELYFNEQAANYVPFPAGQAPSWVPTPLLGLTNQQLWNQYGLSFAGAVAPASATTAAGLNGLLGPATNFPPPLTMVSPVVATQLTGYQLVYLDASGNRVFDPTLVNLSPGWNLITRTIGGLTRTFFVHGLAFPDVNPPAGGGGSGSSGSSSGSGSGSGSSGSGPSGGGPPLSADEAFVQALYQDFLHRSGSPGELDGWVASLPLLGRSGVASLIIRSGEALTDVISQVYQTYLQRAPDATGEAAWLAFLQNGGTEEQFITRVVSSEEYAADVAARSGGSDAAFVQSLYNTILGRTGSASEIGFWLGVLPTLSRAGVAAAFVGSGEYRSDQITQFYSSLLHRSASASEVAGWVNSGADLLSIEVAFASSGEFYANR